MGTSHHSIVGADAFAATPCPAAPPRVPTLPLTAPGAHRGGLVTDDARGAPPPEFLHALGAACYHFADLERVVLTIIARVNGDGFARVPRGELATVTAKALGRAVSTARPPLPYGLRRDLTRVLERFREAIRVRNRLLHAPLPASDDLQPPLRTRTGEWSVQELREAAAFFQMAANEADTVFHRGLAKARPPAAG